VGKSDVGAVRMLLEGKILFDVVDLEADFQMYKVLILPDDILITDEIAGKLLATGRSGMNTLGDQFVLDIGVKWISKNPYHPDYFKPNFELQSLRSAAYIFYGEGQKIALDGGVELGHREDPYFNRETFSFSSHQHTPNTFVCSGPGMVESEQGI
jgi:hypothetical protein